MGGRREVSIVSHRPVIRSDLKQERSIFRGSVSTFLRLLIFHKFVISLGLSKNSSKESRLEKVLPYYKHSQLSNHCNVLIHRNNTAFKVSRFTKKKITTYRAEGSCLNTNAKWRPAQHNNADVTHANQAFDVSRRNFPVTWLDARFTLTRNKGNTVPG